MNPFSPVSHQRFDTGDCARVLWKMYSPSGSNLQSLSAGVPDFQVRSSSTSKWRLKTN